MLAFVTRRILVSIPVLVVATVVVFFGVSAVGDPLGEVRRTPNISQVTLDNVIAAKHLDQSLFVQYGYWVKDSLTNFEEPFGTTLFGRPIWPNLRRAFGHTLQLVIAAEIVALTLGLGIGVLAAKRQYSFLDYTTTSLSFLGYSIPIFWFALILQVLATNFFVATDIRLFYTGGLSSPGAESFLLDRVQHLALPVIALAYVNLSLYSRYSRSSLLEVVHSDYVRTARAKGVGEGKVVRRHALRNALIPVVTVAAINFGSLFGGAIVTETVFALDGMGLFFIRALGDREVYSLMAYLVVTAILVILGSLAADILYGVLDPRIRNE